MEWFGRSYQSLPFSMFSISHLVMLSLFIIITMMMVVYRRNILPDKWGKAEIGLAISLIGLEATNQFWMFHNGLWRVGRSLPLELCNIGLLLCILLLLTKKSIFFELLFFLAIFGATLAIFTPALKYDFPHYRFFHFFIAHAAIVWVSLYYWLVKGYKLTFYSVIKLLIFLNTLLPVVLYVNQMHNGNYWFLRHKPVSPSLFDIMGPYPWYILTFEGMLLMVCIFGWLLIRFGHTIRNQSQSQLSE
ncbi:TIGR02206 family membrane protein [Chungangia koreensis]|uniref:TIGR02206 family membrane protein n=1 Tax=Chungangia koreensis TaxID=752657 RepID=A0ABV8X1I3_9LACT